MTVYFNTLKRILINPLNWLFLLMFPVIFALLISLTQGSENIQEDLIDPMEARLTFGIIDEDESALSGALLSKLETRFNLQHVASENITALLIDQEILWILKIPGGYGEAILSGAMPELEGYSLSISDVSAMGSAGAESITKALMLLGTDDEAVLSAWAKESKLEVSAGEAADNWPQIAYWFGFYTFIAMLTAYFVVKVLTDDKKRGMPDRLGVCPHTPRKHLILCALAAATATEITVILIMGAVTAILGAIPNFLPLFLLVSLYNLFSVSLVLAVVSAAKDLGAASAIVMLGASLLSMLGGIFWPLSIVPEFMQSLACVSPGYWMVRGIEGIRELSFESFWMGIIMLSGFTLVAVLFGGWGKIKRIADDD